ncbi:MAG: helicase [Magnetococcales bacterium]|nr:helicase [Magnetococcales bacterium]
MPILRPRQDVCAKRVLKALKVTSSTLAVAPTGAGKTFILSAVCSKLPGRHLILQHSDKLLEQNKATYELWNGTDTSIVNANCKDFTGQAVFAMVQTLSRDGTIEALDHFHFDVLVIDEGHHATAPTYKRIIEAVKAKNPNVKIFLVTATPMRGDGAGLGQVVDSVADVITLEDLIAAGNLVMPRTFIIDIGCQQELQDMPIVGIDYDMDRVAEIMNKDIHNERIVKEWQEHAGDRQTIVFCSTVQHAKDVCAAFQKEGIKAGVVHGSMTTTERDNTLNAFECRQLQVLVNVMVLTEGYDCQIVSCVVLLCPSSQHSTLLQMIGRGLRIVTPDKYPDESKEDCVILDFGTSCTNHGSLEQNVSLEDQRAFGSEGGDAPSKECPNCEAPNPLSVKVCSLCGQEFNPAAMQSASLSTFTMREVKLVKQSPYKWQSVNPRVLVSTSFNSWAMVIFHKDTWHAVGATANNTPVAYLAKGKRLAALSAANDFMCRYGSTADSGKRKSWLRKDATEKQLKALNDPLNFGMNRYEAACRLTLKFNKAAIGKLIN